MKFIFFGSIILCLVIFILISLHYTSFGIFSLDPTSGAIVAIPIGTSGTTSAYGTSTIPTYLSTKFTGVKQINYTVSFDAYISSSQNTDTYRVLFYNGKQIRDPSIQACSVSVTTNCDGNLGKCLTQGSSNESAMTVSPNSLASIQNALFANNGNICVYLSPDTNDLNIMYYVAGQLWNTDAKIITKWKMGSSRIEYGSGSGSDRGSGTIVTGGSTPVYSADCGSGAGVVRIGDVNYNCESGSSATGTRQNSWVTTLGPTGNYVMGTDNQDAATITVKNIPLQTPFRVTLVVDPNFIEVYMNGNLVITAKTPVASEIYIHPGDGVSGTNFMGPPDFSSYCKVGNITYWNQVLPAKSIRLLCSTPAAASVFKQE
jgi:hypothetical protein